VTNTGFVTINFSEERIDDAMLAQIKALEKEPKNENEQLTEDSEDEVKPIFGRSEGKNEEILTVYILPDESSDSSKLNFSYEVKSFTSTQMQL